MRRKGLWLASSGSGRLLKPGCSRCYNLGRHSLFWISKVQITSRNCTPLKARLVWASDACVCAVLCLSWPARVSGSRRNAVGNSAAGPCSSSR